MLKVTMTVEVTLQDWLKAGKLSLKQEIGSAEDDAGNKFKLYQSVGGMVVSVNQEGTHHQASVLLRPLFEQMCEALVKHRSAIEAQPGKDK